MSAHLGITYRCCCLVRLAVRAASLAKLASSRSDCQLLLKHCSMGGKV